MKYNDPMISLHLGDDPVPSAKTDGEQESEEGAVTLRTFYSIYTEMSG
jgi:hypothetical protein